MSKPTPQTRAFAKEAIRVDALIKAGLDTDGDMDRLAGMADAARTAQGSREPGWRIMNARRVSLALLAAATSVALLTGARQIIASRSAEVASTAAQIRANGGLS